MDWLQSLAAVGLVAVLLILTVSVLRPGGGRNALTSLRAKFGTSVLRRLRRDESLALTSGHHLHVVVFDGRSFLIATHSRGASLLAGPPADFRAVMANAAEGFSEPEGSR